MFGRGSMIESDPKSLKLVCERGANQLMITVQCVSIGSTHVLLSCSEKRWQSLRFTDLYKIWQHVLDLESLSFTGRLQPADKFLNCLTGFAGALSVAQSTVAKRTFAIKSLQKGAVASEHVRTVEGIILCRKWKHMEARLPTVSYSDCHPNKSASSNFVQTYPKSKLLNELRS